MAAQPNQQPFIRLPNRTQTLREIHRLSQRLSDIRTAASDYADQIGYIPGADQELRHAVALCTITEKECHDVRNQIRDTMAKTEEIARSHRATQLALQGPEERQRANCLASSADMLSWMVKREPLVVMLLRSYGSKLPDEMALQIQRASPRQDLDAFGQALSQRLGAHPMVDTSALQQQVDTLTQERNARDSMIKDLQDQLANAENKALVLQTDLEKLQSAHDVVVSQLDNAESGFHDLEKQLRDQVAVSDKRLEKIKHLILGQAADPGWRDQLARHVLDDTETACTDWRCRLELLPSWTNLELPERRQDMTALTLELLSMCHGTRWDDGSGVFETLRALICLFGRSDVILAPTWILKVVASVVVRALDQSSPTFAVRVASWHLIWLLRGRWQTQVGQPVSYSQTDALLHDIYHMRILPTTTDTDVHCAAVAEFIFIRPADAGFLMFDPPGATVRWVSLEMVTVDFDAVTIKIPRSLASKRLDLCYRQIEWCLLHLT